MCLSHSVSLYWRGMFCKCAHQTTLFSGRKCRLCTGIHPYQAFFRSLDAIYFKIFQHTGIKLAKLFIVSVGKGSLIKPKIVEFLNIGLQQSSPRGNK